MQYGISESPSQPRYFLAIDLAHRQQDSSALAIIERQGINTDAPLALRHLHRFPLNTSYPSIVAEVRSLLSRPPLSQPSTMLAVNGSDVGTAVVSLFQQAGLHVMVRPVYITGGATESREGNTHYVPKLELISVVQATLQTGRLKIAGNLPEASNLVRELQDFSLTAAEIENNIYAGRQGKSGDLVLSTALALWLAEKNYMPFTVIQF